MYPRRLRFLSTSIGLFCGLLALPASAEPKRALALPTQITTQLDCSVATAPNAPIDAASRTLARRVDGLVADAIEDAGVELVMRSTMLDVERHSKTCHSELDLLEMAKKDWVISPQVIRTDNRLVLRLVAAEPNSPSLRVVTREITEQDLDVRAIVMVSQLLVSQKSESATPKSDGAAPQTSGKSAPKVTKSHSAGRGVLTLSSGILGGAVGYSLQRASGSDDPRLTYPLIALGTGIGVGAAMIAADEWDVSVPDAWYLSAGMLWPAASGLLLARAYQVKPSTDRYVYGLAGAAAGMTLASFAIGTTEMSEGGAMVAHSGGAMGLLMGGLLDMTVSGTTSHIPWHGMGYGAGLGVLVAGAAATKLQVSSSRVLFINMAAGLGALTGAAAGSPILFVENESISEKRQRAWLSVIGVGAVAGAGLGYYLTRHWVSQEHVGSGAALVWPYATVAPSLGDLTSTPSQGMTAGLQGIF